MEQLVVDSWQRILSNMLTCRVAFAVNLAQQGRIKAVLQLTHQGHVTTANELKAVKVSYLTGKSSRE